LGGPSHGDDHLGLLGLDGLLLEALVQRFQSQWAPPIG
jgi:hypothetical protein